MKRLLRLIGRPFKWAASWIAWPFIWGYHHIPEEFWSCRVPTAWYAFKVTSKYIGIIAAAAIWVGIVASGFAAQHIAWRYSLWVTIPMTVFICNMIWGWDKCLTTKGKRKDRY